MRFRLTTNHVLGTHEPRMIQEPHDRPTLHRIFSRVQSVGSRCVNGGKTRLLDLAFVDAGLGIGRLSQIRTAGAIAAHTMTESTCS